MQDDLVRDTLRSILTNYHKNIRPNYTGSPTIVHLDFSILGFGEMNERDMTFHLDVFLRQRWFDYRLRHNLSEILIPMLGHKIPSDLIWTPDTHIKNAKKAKKHQVTVSNEKLDIYPDGKVFWGSRISVIASCKMDFRFYPMDIQRCPLYLESYAYDVEHIQYRWVDKGVVVLSDKMSQYTLSKLNYTSDFNRYLIGNYSALNTWFTFERRMANSIMQIFFPCVAIVLVSMLPLWFHKNCASPRVGIGVTTLLTICTIWGSINRRLPRVNYIKAIDIYFITSFCFILCTLLEYTLVMNVNFETKKKRNCKCLKRQGAIRKRKIPPNESSSFLLESSFFTDTLQQVVTAAGPFERALMKRSSKRVSKRASSSDSHECDGNCHMSDEELDEKPTWWKIYPVDEKPTTIDAVSRVLFPLGYFCFNLYFWVTYHGKHGKH